MSDQFVRRGCPSEIDPTVNRRVRDWGWIPSTARAAWTARSGERSELVPAKPSLFDFTPVAVEKTAA